MKLILTADDFGRSTEINAAVVEAHRRGILTAASLMVGGDAFEQAVELARATPTLAVGLHVVVVDGAPTLPPHRLCRLVDANGRLPDSPARLGIRYFLDSAARSQILAEIRSQFARFAATGLKLAHVDGHQHMHLHPSIFPYVRELAEHYGAAGIRLPRDELRFALQYDRSRALMKIAWTAVFGILSMRARRQLRGHRLAVAQRVYGLMQSGRMEPRYVRALLNHVRGNSAEIYFHPTRGPRTDALGPNPQDFGALLDPAARDVIEARELHLCSYAGLVEGNE